jgi:carotenoid cleavage dioxygenase-like enzyme
MSNSYDIGFQSLEKTVSHQELPVQGSIPSWLDGHFLRNGPALFEVEQRRYNHWFDGLAMLHRFELNKGTVFYTNKFLESRNFTDVKATRQFSYDQFSTNPKRNLFQKLIDTLDYGLQFGNNNLVSFGRFGDELLALGETPTPISINPRNIATKGVFKFSDWMLSMITIAHPTYDDLRQCVFSYSTRVLPFFSSYKIWRMPYGSQKRSVICSIKPRLGQPAYMHSIGVTENYLILAEMPLVISPAKMMFNVWTDSPFITNFSWKPDLGTLFLIVNKDTGCVTGSYKAEPFFSFHHVNAWEEDGDIVLDISAYNNPSVIQQTYLDSLLSSNGGSFCYSGLRRYRMPIEGKGTISSHQELSKPAFEMPWIHPDFGGRPYRYAYGYGYEEAGNLNDCLVKIDVQNSDLENNYKVWSAPNCYPSEGVFVPRPHGNAEDDGVVLSIVLDSEKAASFLLILDATSFNEIARAPTPFPIPFGLHGAFNNSFAGPPPTGKNS